MEKSIKDRIGRSGSKLPEIIANPPELKSNLLFYFDAFAELTSERPCGFEPLPIPRSVIIEYGSFYGFEGVDLEIFLKLMRIMDSQHLLLIREKSK